MELIYEITDKQKKEFQHGLYHKILRFRNLSKGSECDAGSENVIILTLFLFTLVLKLNNINNYYYSFKIFPRFGLVETTRIIHHNQLLFTKFGKNLRHIQSMTSKVEPAANYSTVDVKMTSKVEPAADYSTVDRKNLGTRL